MLLSEFHFFFPSNSWEDWFQVAAVKFAFVPAQDLVEKLGNSANPQGSASIHSLEIESQHSKHCNGNNTVSCAEDGKT